MARNWTEDQLRAAARRAAQKHGIDPHVFERQIGAESGWNINAGSPAGARDIAQFMPGTAAGMGVKLGDGNPLDDLDAAARMDARALKQYGGSWKDALTAYNAGPGRVGKPLYAETANYISKILGGKGDAHDSPTPSAGGGASQPAGHSEVTFGTQSVTTTDPDLARKQFFAQWLAKKKPNSPLLALGALDPNMSTTRTTQVPVATGVRTVGGPSGSGSTAPITGAGPSRAVAEAAKRLGVSEVGGSNRGARLDSWQRKFGMLGQPWCGIFVGLALEKAGVRGITPRVASVAAIEQDARAGKGGFKAFLPPTQARPGDALVVRSGGHVALVASVDSDGTIHTIEGNTGNGTVARRTHRPGDVVGVARPRF